MNGSSEAVAWRDRVFWEMSRRYRVRPMVCGIYLPLDREPDLARLRARVAALVVRFPELRRRIVERTNAPVWTPTNAPVWAPTNAPCDAHVSTREQASWSSHADVVAQLAAGMSDSLATELPPWRVVVMRGAGCVGLFVQWHHALTDGEGMLGLLEALSDADAEAEAGRDLRLLDPSLRTDLDAPVDAAVRARASRLVLRIACARARERGQRLLGSDRFRVLPILSQVDSESLSQLRAGYSVSTNELLVALATDAVLRYERRRYRNPASLRVLSPVSDRTQRGRVQLGNHSRALRLSLDLRGLCNFTALTTRVRATSSHALAHGNSVPYAVYRMVFSMPALARDRLLAGGPRYIVNYMPWADTPRWIAGARVERFHGFTPMLPFHGCTFAVAGYRGALHANLVCDTLLLEQPEAMVECLDEALVAARRGVELR